jgi:hypothetical protein
MCCVSDALPCARITTAQEALSAVKAWTAHPTMETAQLMGSTQAATMMLAMRPPQRMSLEVRGHGTRP